MEQPLFRKKSLDRISSPEQLDEYLHVTDPTVWLLLVAAILILAGLLIWGSFASIKSYANGTAVVKDGTMTVYFDDADLAQNVSEGMAVKVGEVKTTITSMGEGEDGSRIAIASSGLADGTYDASVNYKQTQVLSILFN